MMLGVAERRYVSSLIANSVSFAQSRKVVEGSKFDVTVDCVPDVRLLSNCNPNGYPLHFLLNLISSIASVLGLAKFARDCDPRSMGATKCRRVELSENSVRVGPY